MLAERRKSQQFGRELLQPVGAPRQTHRATMTKSMPSPKAWYGVATDAARILVVSSKGFFTEARSVASDGIFARDNHQYVRV
jgi:hypothetical protein